MWSVIGLGIVTLFIIIITHCFYKWNNPKCNGVLPPGSMGFPLVGETLQFIMPSRSIDIHPFIKTRIQRYGAVFRTSLVGRPLVVSADPEFNSFIFQQEGNAVEMWYLDSFSQIFDLDGETRLNSVGSIHKYVRSKVLNQFGSESVKEKLLPQLEKMVHKTLSIWPSQTSIEVKQATATVVFDFTAKQMFGHDYEKSLEQISDTFANFLQGLISFPLNIPGTTFHKCMKDKKKILNMINNMLKEKLTSTTAETCQGDFLDQTIKDLSSEKFLTEDFIVLLSFGTLFASVESLSTTLTLAFKLLSENPSVVEELRAEHETIIRNRDISDSALTWDEYKSMTFTLQVIDEINRLANVIPGFLRRTLKDIQVNGYTIPAGWMIMVITSSLHLDPNTFKDPLAFNPWRWKGMDSIVISKNFMPFGGGLRQCAGAVYAKVFMATFIHVLVTKYRWTKIKGGDVVRAPILGFGDGIQIKVWEKA